MTSWYNTDPAMVDCTHHNFVVRTAAYNNALNELQGCYAVAADADFTGQRFEEIISSLTAPVCRIVVARGLPRVEFEHKPDQEPQRKQERFLRFLVLKAIAAADPASLPCRVQILTSRFDSNDPVRFKVFLEADYVLFMGDPQPLKDSLAFVARSLTPKAPRLYGLAVDMEQKAVSVAVNTIQDLDSDCWLTPTLLGYCAETHIKLLTNLGF